MCDQRERLLDYLYDECEAGERQLVETHLATCETCRDEIGSLRRARQDLLAWDVPDHGSVWKPFAPARIVPSWRDLPRGALATAAGVMFLIGAAGGFATRAFAPVSASAAPAGAAPIVQAGATAADLAAMEQRVLAEMRTEMDQHVSLVPSHVVDSTGSRASSDVMARVEKLISLSEQRQGGQLDRSARAVLTDLSNFHKTDQKNIDWLIAQVNKQGLQLSTLLSQQPGR